MEEVTGEGTDMDKAVEKDIHLDMEVVPGEGMAVVVAAVVVVVVVVGYSNGRVIDDDHS
jgi:hypothetical protein